MHVVFFFKLILSIYIEKTFDHEIKQIGYDDLNEKVFATAEMS